MADSIWKKEIHLGRRKRQAVAEQVTAVVAAPAPLVETPAESAAAEERPLPWAPDPLPTWKRTSEAELAAPVVLPPPVVEPAWPLEPRWDPEPDPAPEPPPAAEAAPPVEEPVVEPAPAPEAEKVPLLKREISLRRRRAEPVPATDPGSPLQDREVPVAPPAPAAEKVPLLKRELRLPRPRRTAATKTHRAEQVVGLRIGSSQIAAARVRNNGSRELLQLARMDLPPGLVAGGEVREPAALAEAIKKFFAENKLPRKGVRLGVASSRIGVRVLEVPPIDDPRQLENAIRFRAHEAIPIPLADALLDHVVIGEGVADDGSPVQRVLVAFAHRDLVTRHADVCRKAGLRLRGVDLEGFALLRALCEPPAEGSASHAVVAVAVGNDRTVFAVSDGHVCEFTRVLDWGGSSLDAALTRALDIDREEAARLKLGLSLLPGDGGDAGLGALHAEAARAAIRDELGALSRELVSSLNFYQSRDGSLDLRELLITGGAVRMPGLPEELQRLVGAPVRLGDPLGRVTISKKVGLPEDAGSFAVAVGLGIEA